MKALFNCSAIKNVYLKQDILTIELEITYTDDANKTWRRGIRLDGLHERKYYEEMYEKYYNTIKQALLNNDKFVEIEL